MAGLRVDVGRSCDHSIELHGEFIPVRSQRDHRITSVNQSLQTAFDSNYLFKAILDHDERRPGARVFGRSGTVGDVVLFRIQLTKSSFDISQREA